MRAVFSILLFTAFAIRPAIEISAILYYQLNIDYIVEKYCINKERPALKCNGKCYLMSQMGGNTQQSETDSEAIVITESFIPLYFQETGIGLKNDQPTFLYTITHNWKLSHLQNKEVSKDIDHPPDC